MKLICHHKLKISSSIAVLKKYEIITRDITKWKFFFNSSRWDTKAQLSICIPSVGENFEVNGAFLGFVELSSTDALTITNWRQGNDGYSTMIGDVSCVQKRIKNNISSS